MKLVLPEIFYKGCIFFLISLIFISCKKNPPDPEPKERTGDQIIQDSIYYYYKLYSLWADQYIPHHQQAYEFTDNYRSADAVLTALKGLTPVYANYSDYGGFLDRFSFIDGLHGYDTGTQSKLKMDRNDGYGLYISMGTIDSKFARPIIYFVEGGSPAAKLGLKRSDIITSINGDSDYAVAINCGANGCEAVDKNALDQMTVRVADALKEGEIKLELLRQDQTTYSKSLSYSNYTIDPLYVDTVYEYPNKNVGYFALSSFEEIENNNANQQKVDAAFRTFDNKHIEDLIVDLRYNTGGYVDAAVYIASKIGGKTTAGKLMVTYQCNAYMDETQKGPNGMFKDTYYSNESNLNLRKVYFLVSEKTASAAEMLINVLKPYMDVMIIGSPPPRNKKPYDGVSRTYGKPVGFFEKIIENKVSFWPASFQLKNADGFSSYWDGLAADLSNIKDYIFLNSGDTEETMLETALADSVPSSLKKASVRKVNQQKKHQMMIGQQVNALPERGLLKSQ